MKTLILGADSGAIKENYKVPSVYEFLMVAPYQTNKILRNKRKHWFPKCKLSSNC